MYKILFFLGILIACPVMAKVCPEGGKPSSTDSHYCCKGPYTSAFVHGLDGSVREEYKVFNPYLCGCPDGGTMSSDKRYCCKNGYQYSDTGYSTMNADACGCPNGAKNINGKCCKDGWIGDWYNSRICGCPEGGKMNPEDNICVKDNYSYNPHIRKYANVSAEDYGCPKGTKKVESVCCKNGFSYDNNEYTWTKVDGRCGCPKGGKPSSVTHPLEEVPCCKNNLMWNEKTREYDLKNDYFCNPNSYALSDAQRKNMEEDPEKFFDWWEEHKSISKDKLSPVYETMKKFSTDKH